MHSKFVSWEVLMKRHYILGTERQEVDQDKGEKT